MIKLQAIKPNTKRIDFTRFSAAAKLGLKDAADDALKDFAQTAASWTHKPTFVAKAQQNGVLIGTDDDVWNMLDGGTRAHLIVAQRSGRLRFSSGGTAKTRPGFIGSVAGTKGGGAVFARVVHHPGTQARSWSKLIAAKYRAQIGRYVQARIREAV